MTALDKKKRLTAGAWQEAHGGRVLLIDLDPQYNLTQTFYSMEAADASVPLQAGESSVNVSVSLTYEIA